MAYKEPHTDKAGAKSIADAFGQINANMAKGKSKPAAKKQAGGQVIPSRRSMNTTSPAGTI